MIMAGSAFLAIIKGRYGGNLKEKNGKLYVNKKQRNLAFILTVILALVFMQFAPWGATILPDLVFGPLLWPELHQE